jgi:ATP-dependent DNA helicase RecG
MDFLSLPVQNAYYIGEKYAKLLSKLDIFTIKDLIYYYPVKYADSRDIKRILDVEISNNNIIQGTVSSIKNIYTRSRKVITKANVYDESGMAEIIWFGQEYIPSAIKEGNNVIFSGKVYLERGKIVFKSPQFEVLKENIDPIHFSRITPIYSQTKGISSKWLRAKIKNILDKIVIEDYIPTEIRDKYNLLEINEALQKLHFPKEFSDIESAKRRLGFEEILYIQVLFHIRNEERKKRSSYRIEVDKIRINEFIKGLNFPLTKSQIRSIREIYDDIKKGIPMNRLLEGDVGSGKTIVAVVATYATYLNHLQTAIMVPTSILANQHYNTLKKLFDKFKIPIQIITSNTSKVDRNAQIIVGTHALLYKNDIFRNLGLVIIDEQHRFGIKQREEIVSKGIYPHILSMTATPIPRTLALGIYGDLDISTLDEMPKNRIATKTYIVPYSKRDDAYQFIKTRVEKGEQAYIIYPIIKESENSELKAAEKEYEVLKNKVFPSLRVEIIHGKVKNKERVLEDFANKKIDILISTSVIEVGIDVKDATVMVIENPERFGLSQLHQLRGRIGRSNKQSYCLLFTPDIENERIMYFCKHNNGLELAEYDLKIRGPGEIFGENQSGRPDLKMASLLDPEIIKLARMAAPDIIENLSNYPKLQEKIIEAQEKVLTIN